MNTVAPYTFASLHAIFSGMYPSKNGVNGYYNIFKFKKDKITTFPELLQKAGYYTSYDIIDDSVIPSQGFDEKNVFDEKTVNFKERHVDMIKELSTKKKFFLFLNKHGNQILNLKNFYIQKAIHQSCLIKKRIVEIDENEKNLRKILNFGHTFAHAYEATIKFSKKLNHGEAVLLGINSAINFSFSGSSFNHFSVISSALLADKLFSCKAIVNEYNIPTSLCLLKISSHKDKNSFVDKFTM